MKKIILLFTTLATVCLSSCLKDGRVNFAPGTSPMVIQWATAALGDVPLNAATATYRAYSRSYVQQSAITMNLQVSLTGTDPATEDITVGIGLNNAAVTPTTAQPLLPTTVYTMPTSVVIVKGTRTATVPVVLNTNAFDVTKTYLFPVQITSTTKGQISGNYGTVVYQVQARNKYDGIYNAKGIFVRGGDPVLSGYFKNLTYTLTTTGANSVTFVQTFATGATVGGITGTTITVDPATSAVTMSATGNAGLMNNTLGIIDPVGTAGTGYNSRWDESKKEFYISFQWNGVPPSNTAAGRAAQDTLTFLRLRP